MAWNKQRKNRTRNRTILLMEKPIKQKKCKICKSEFTPQRPLQNVCGYKCAAEHANNLKVAKEKKEDKVKREKLKTHSELLKAAQIVFNKFIRLRDKDKPCISCDKPLIGNDVNASHYFSVGAYPNLRFNEFNVSNSCIRCNKELHGNISEYALRLPLRIGKDNFEKLVQDRNIPALYSKEDILEIIKKYKIKIKELQNKTLT